MDTVAMLKADDIKALIGALSKTIADHADELTALDSAIGDGDHGYNMKRGFEALAGEADALSAKPIGEALKAAGMKLVMTVGGASGPLFGTLLMTLGKEIGETPDRAAFNAAFRKAVDSVAVRGKSEKGQKTMLDVLYPISDALDGGGDPFGIKEVADEAANATIPVIASRGRASFLGERSAGHMDPGSRSVALMARTISDFMETRR
ncbi:dihydroxyacetone kinase subunit DhaL [Rhizobium sp. TH2]|uniref:dihydroxyacetone kinase subunit DhaL n=1 Tax=Rhizobium sp. TH2 TaxID=2775403 RepID=UPI0021576390|nr:dihydroxyacetone kinase subunit DhaL [Rhizobium sp. TH2]